MATRSLTVAGTVTALIGIVCFPGPIAGRAPAARSTGAAETAKAWGVYRNANPSKLSASRAEEKAPADTADRQ